VFIGANGSGKTRLGVFIEKHLSPNKIEVHRISAHRSLLLDPNVVPPSFEVATKRLLYGYDQGDYRNKNIGRWGDKPETALLNDFEHLIAAQYAENNEISVKYRQNQMGALNKNPPPKARIDKLKEIWETVLPHRQLAVYAGNIKVSPPSTQEEYPASDMSDGERVIFYLIGQALVAKPDTLFIFDEPELHINKSILNRLWDAIESARPDCGFIYITHDVEFASSRHAATKYAVRSYRKAPNKAWDIEVIPENTEIPTDVVAKIIGSRRPVLFVEGDSGSLDSSIYRRVYDDFTVIAVGSCDDVIHTVASFAARTELHHVNCAGLVDADGRTDDDAIRLKQNKVYRLPVSEIENLLLLPNAFLAIAKALRFNEDEAKAKLDSVRNFVFNLAEQQIDQICLRYTQRRVDAEMKKINLSKIDGIQALDIKLRAISSDIDAHKIFTSIKDKINSAISSQNYEKILLYYDNKGLLSEAAKELKSHQKALKQFVERILRSDEPSELHLVLVDYLPKIEADLLQPH